MECFTNVCVIPCAGAILIFSVLFEFLVYVAAEASTIFYFLHSIVSVPFLYLDMFRYTNTTMPTVFSTVTCCGQEQ